MSVTVRVLSPRGDPVEKLIKTNTHGTIMFGKKAKPELEGPGRPKGATKEATVQKKIEELIHQYGIDNIDLLMKEGMKMLQQGGAGIKFDITITKQDLNDEKLMGTVKDLIAVSQGTRTLSSAPAPPKELEKLAGFMNFIGANPNMLDQAKKQWYSP